MRKSELMKAPKPLMAGNSKKMVKFFDTLSLILPAMVIILLLTGYPMYQIIKFSFSESTSISSDTSTASLQNFINVFTDPLFWNAAKNTIIFCFSSVGVELVFSLGVALLLNRPINSIFRSFFRSILMFPWLLSSTVIAALWILIFTPFGLVNGVIEMLGIHSLVYFPWLGDERTALFSIIVANIWRGFPFMMLMLLAGLQTVPEELYEAAMIDGASGFQRLVNITIPQIREIIFTVTMLEIIWNFRAFDLVFLMTGGGPMNSSEILSTFIYNQAFRRIDFGYASASSIIMLTVMILIAIPYLKISFGKLKR